MNESVLNGESNAVLMQATNAVVRILSDYLGRGPTRARAHLSDNVLLIVTQDNLTKAERKLVEEGEAAAVRELRRRFQKTMEADLVGAVEGLTGRTVVAFLSDHDPHTDYGTEIFILDAQPEPRPL